MADIDIKFPTMDEFAKEVAEKALDEFLYGGKSIREWMQIIASEDAISRQAVLDVIEREQFKGDAISEIEKLPPVTPQPCEVEATKLQQAYNKGFEDCRQAVIEYIEGSEAELGHSSENELVCQYIKELPPVNPQEPKTGQWIPVSERLPEKDKYTDFYKCLVAVRCTSRNNICESFSAYFDGKHFYSRPYDRAFISEVKAWMPLPEPYKPYEPQESEV